MEHFYHKLPGDEHWFDYELVYASMVRHFRDGAHFVEVGSYKGRSSVYMAVEIINSGKDIKFDCVDHFKGSEEHYKQDGKYETLELKQDPDYLFKEFSRNIEPVKDRIKVHKMSSVDAAKLYQDRSLDFVFLDGGHTEADLLADIKAWRPKLKPGGILAGHDYSATDYPDVQRVIDTVFPERALIWGKVTYCWAVLMEGFIRSNKSTRIM